MLAALVEVEAEGEEERHQRRGWKRCAKLFNLLGGPDKASILVLLTFQRRRQQCSYHRAACVEHLVPLHCEHILYPSGPGCCVWRMLSP